MWVLPCGVYRQEIREYWSPVGCRDCGIRAPISQMASLCSQQLNESLRPHSKQDQGQRDHSLVTHQIKDNGSTVFGVCSLPLSFTCFSLYLWIWVSVHLPISLSIHPSIHLFIYPSTHLLVFPPIRPSTHPPIYLSTQPASQPGSRSALTVNALKPGLSLTRLFPRLLQAQCLAQAYPS